MSFQITEAFVQEYASNIFMLSQQKGSRLRPLARQESMSSKAKAFDRIGTKNASLRTTRHPDTPQVDTPHSKRWCYLADYHDGDLIDDMDKIRVLNEPTSEYMMASMWALGRSMDDVLIAAADASAVTGEDQSGSASHPNSQKVVANDGSNHTNLNVNTLIQIKSKFGQNDIDDSIPLHIIVTQKQLDALLGDDQVTSADYNTVKALVRGEVDSYMGFKFHRTQRLDNQASTLSADPSDGSVGSGGTDVNGSRKIIALTQNSLILGLGKDITARISERADKCYSVQAYASMSLGAVRMEEEQVVIGFCNESA